MYINKSVKFLISIIGILFIQVAVSKNAFAYLDPGAGSYIFQVLISIIFGAGFAIKIFWQKINGFFKALFLKGKKQ